MISMQRSLSSPVCIRSSPPESPNDARAASRSPTPPPAPEVHLDVGSSRRLAFRNQNRISPEGPRVAPFPRSDDLPNPTSSQMAVFGPKPRPIIDQPSASEVSDSARNDRPSMSSLLADDAEERQPKPVHMTLLPDVSLYTNPQLEIDAESTSLEELAHLVRLSKHQERKRAQTRVRLQRNLITTALSVRLTRCGELAHRRLADCFRSDEKDQFASLYNAIHNVRKSIEELRRYALLEPDMDVLHPAGLGSSESLDTATGSLSSNATGPLLPFLDDISADARETFIGFLVQLRNNPDFLATRLSALSDQELAALTTFHQGLEPINTVLPFHNRPSTRGRSAPRSSAASSNSVERLLSFQRHDPLSALIHTCFANSAGPDSTEDRKRTDVWATACARLIADKSPASEPFLTAVISAWTSMREWAGRSNMEYYLMNILEDGAFLLDRAEDQHGTRFNLSHYTSKEHIAAEEFYDRATDGLFDILDDEDATGIPEGLVELGNQILKRLDRDLIDKYRKWFIWKWLFGVWLFGVVIHPESYGLLAEYHIPEYGRQKILKAVALRAQKLVADMLTASTFGGMKATQPVSTPPKVKIHVDNILNRFRGSRSQKTATRLLPARSITSLRETVEVHPYLVVSPADLLTLVNTLYPERRPPSAHSSGMRSGAPSISGFSTISQPILTGSSRSQPETGSVFSTSASSLASEATTSRETLLEEQHTGMSSRHSPILRTIAQDQPRNYDDDGYRLRLAVHEMVRSLGQDAVQGNCHPCAERWAVLFISADGSSLSTHMTYDHDDDPDEEENSSTSDTDEDDADDDRLELDRDYHLLRDSILKLVEDFEIPRAAEAAGDKAHTFSNRAPGLKKYRSRNKNITMASTPQSRNPYRQANRASRPESETSEAHTKDIGGKSVESVVATPQPVLVTMLTAASSQSRAQSDFVSAHLYWEALQRLRAITSDSLRQNGYSALLNIFSRGPRDSIHRSASANEEYDAWLVWLKQSQERAEGLIGGMMKRLQALRDKMWYVTDVRNSAQYECSRNIALALKTMGSTRKWTTDQRSRQRSMNSPAAFIASAQNQIADLLTAPQDQGGPNKLSDDQAEKTLRWLQQLGVENFCQGEERIHRFCCEVDECIGKLIGESIVDGPVLWSSVLYTRDRRILEGTKPARDRDIHSWDDSASVISDSERRFSTSSRPLPSALRSLRDMSNLNASRHSLESGRYSFSAASTALSDIADGPDYFGGPSPAPTIDTQMTFWSPFHGTSQSPSSVASRAYFPAISNSSLSGSQALPDQHRGLSTQSHHGTGRPGTSASTTETIYQERLSKEKQRFLAELRQTLTSLLLSDLGNVVFAQGSETDGWFGTLGQECIDRREALDRRARKSTTKERDRRKANRSSLKQRVIEKKRSFTDLRGATGEAARSVDAGPSQNDTMSQGHDSSTTTTDAPRASANAPTRDSMPEFPFTKAYQRLLRMFCVHPNPQAKMDALHELEHLITASLASGGSRKRLAWLARLSTTSEALTGGNGGVKPLSEAIDNVRERRSHTLAYAPPASFSARSPTSNFESRSIMSVAPSNADAVTNILQSLFRDPTIRPKSLFRDLQFIAAFVPTSILDGTERGKAFWDTGLAALSLKREVCTTMVEVADEIVAHTHAQSRKGISLAPEPVPMPDAMSQSSASQSGHENVALPPSPPSPLPPVGVSMADAARIWTIAAREGDPTSQRELALCYLGSPELVDKITLPLSKPREVFKKLEAKMENYGGGSGSSGGGRYSGLSYQGSSLAGAMASGGSGGISGAAGGDARSDPALMRVAYHWMMAAREGGDDEARRFCDQHGIAGNA